MDLVPHSKNQAHDAIESQEGNGQHVGRLTKLYEEQLQLGTGREPGLPQVGAGVHQDRRQRAQQVQQRQVEKQESRLSGKLLGEVEDRELESHDSDPDRLGNGQNQERHLKSGNRTVHLAGGIVKLQEIAASKTNHSCVDSR